MKYLIICAITSMSDDLAPAMRELRSACREFCGRSKEGDVVMLFTHGFYRGACQADGDAEVLYLRLENQELISYLAETLSFRSRFRDPYHVTIRERLF